MILASCSSSAACAIVLHHVIAKALRCSCALSSIVLSASSSFSCIPLSLRLVVVAGPLCCCCWHCPRRVLAVIIRALCCCRCCCLHCILVFVIAVHIACSSSLSRPHLHPLIVIVLCSCVLGLRPLIVTVSCSCLVYILLASGKTPMVNYPALTSTKGILTRLTN